MIKGRYFTESDGPESPPVAIVNHTLARRSWPGEDGVGRRLKGFNPRGSPLDAEVNRSGHHAGRGVIDRAGRFDSRQRLDTPQHVIEETTHLLAAGVAGLSSHACMVSTPSGLNPRSMPMRFNELRSMRPAPAPHLDHQQRVGEPAARAAACARPAAFAERIREFQFERLETWGQAEQHASGQGHGQRESVDAHIHAKGTMRVTCGA